MARRNRYRWREWLGGECITLIRGVHYTCSQSSFHQQLRSAGTTLRLSLEIDDAGDRFHVVITPRATVEAKP